MDNDLWEDAWRQRDGERNSDPQWIIKSLRSAVVYMTSSFFKVELLGNVHQIPIPPGGMAAVWRDRKGQPYQEDMESHIANIAIDSRLADASDIASPLPF